VATPLWPSFLPTPEQDGYRVSRGNDAVSIRLDGGPARVRRDALATPHEVTATFLCDETDYVGVIGFLRERTFGRTRFFRLPLLIDAPVVVPYLCRQLDEPETLDSTRGLSFEVRVTLEVLPNPILSSTLFLQSVSDDRVAVANTADGYSPNMAEFPVGRDVLLTGCRGTVGGVPINLDGQYVILGAPSPEARTLTTASSVNPGWTTLAATSPFLLFPDKQGGAAILLPE
jgi:hypothetical protein